MAFSVQVLRPDGDCASGIRVLRRSQHLRMRQMAKIFLIIESRIIGRRFAGGPCFFPGFGRVVSIPDLISAGYLPVLATWCLVVSQFRCVFLEVHTLHILHIYSPSSPMLFWFFMVLDGFSITSVVKGVFISAGFIIVCSSAVTAVNMFLKCSVIMLAYKFFFRPGIHHVFPMSNEGFLWFVALFMIRIAW